ncbi:MAG: acyl carrier protein [Synergistaceae bacterium]|jgi:acyl carrier protein|nr:acyl carrier protein [Synergistaceae bacterium]
METRNIILDIAQSVLGEGISEDASMGTCPDWTSIKTLQIVMELDEAGVSIPFEKIAEIRSVADIMRIAGCRAR